MIAPFDYTQKAKGILKALFPKLYTTETLNSFTTLVTDIWGGKNTQIERISKIIENDFIEFIYKNYGTYQGENLSDYFQKELINIQAEEDHQYLTYRLNALKSKYPELSSIPFVAALYEDVYFPPDQPVLNSYKGLDNKEIHNTFFLRNPDNPTFEKNIFTSNWRNLITFDPERFDLQEAYTEEDIKEISNFFNELVYFSLYQSGLTNTGNGFSDLIPYEYWAPFIQEAFSAYEEDKASIRGLERTMMREFEYRFRQMNPKVNWRTKKRALAEKDPKTGKNKTELIQFYKNYYRGKDYKVTPDDLMLTAQRYLMPDEDNGEDIPVDEAPTKVENVADFTPGRFVEGNGTKYILIRELSPGIWQLYNPALQGSGAKTVLRQPQLTTLEEKAAMVRYNGKLYAVTQSNEIHDLVGNKLVTYGSNDQNRINILKLAQEQRTPPDSGIAPEGQPPIEPKC
jgi:hypothetical protein